MLGIPTSEIVLMEKNWEARGGPRLELESAISSDWFPLEADISRQES